MLAFSFPPGQVSVGVRPMSEEGLVRKAPGAPLWKDV